MGAPTIMISAYIPAATLHCHQRGVDPIQRIPIQEEMSAQGSIQDVTWRFLAVHMKPKKKPRRVDVNRGFSLVSVCWREPATYPGKASVALL
jgi:hypothetical protein